MSWNAEGGERGLSYVPASPYHTNVRYGCRTGRETAGERVQQRYGRSTRKQVSVHDGLCATWCHVPLGPAGLRVSGLPMRRPAPGTPSK